MSRQPGQDYPDVLLERYLANDLERDLQAEIERACERSDVLRQRLQELRDSRDAFLAADPPEEFAHRVAARLEFEREASAGRRGRRWLAWLLAPSAAAAAATVLVAVVVMRAGPERAAEVATAPAMVPVASRAAPEATVPAPTAPMAEPAEEAPALAGDSYVRRDLSRTPPKTTKRPKKKARRPSARRSRGGGGGGGGGGGRSGAGSGGAMDELFDAPATPAPAPKSAPGAMGSRSVGSALSQSDITAGVKKGMGAVMGCIKAARAQGELAPGRHTLVLDWTIRPSGEVANPKVKGPANVLGTSLPACFARGMRKWRFPATKKGAPVRNFPFGPFTIE